MITCEIWFPWACTTFCQEASSIFWACPFPPFFKCCFEEASVLFSHLHVLFLPNPTHFSVHCRCSQTAFHGSPLCPVAAASLQPARPARARWQPGSRTRKRWTGVRKVSSCPAWALRVSQQDRHERGKSYGSCNFPVSYLSIPPAPSELLNLVSPLRWLPPASTLSPHFLASLASHTLDSGGDHPAECFLGSTLHPLSWQSTRSLTRPPSLLLCLAHRTVYVPQLLAINSHVILHLIATVAWCGVPLWISHWRLWTSTQFLHYTISQPLDLQKLFPSMSWTWACWFKLDPQTISSLWDGFHLTFKNEKKKKIIITGI